MVLSPRHALLWLVSLSLSFGGSLLFLDMLLLSPCYMCTKSKCKGSGIQLPVFSKELCQFHDAIPQYFLYSDELRHGTCHFYTIYTGVLKINSVHGNIKDQMKLDLCTCICEALSYTSVPWKAYLWAWLSITTNIN